MISGKLIKDAVHGYIEIDKALVSIIDSPEFQRLRNIRQTSYSGLYPSSLHDRFSHSLGTYHLGKKAINSFFANLEKDYAKKIVDIQTKFVRKKEIFLLACLLHDIGHAPFSHIGEEFYKTELAEDIYLLKGEEEKVPAIYNILINVLGEEKCFIKDFKNSLRENCAQPHEIASAIIGLQTYGNLFECEEEKILFARAIIGLKYIADIDDLERDINNCLISLLNSPVIDVDKLDYLARDLMMTGHSGTQIDTERLLASVCLVKPVRENERYFLGFNKDALSVIENVLLAHDSERKWIQKHSFVIYESFITQQCVRKVIDAYKTTDNNTIFSLNALGTKGVKVSGNLKIRLLSDAEIIFLIKQIDENEDKNKYISEFLSRADRKHAIWKTEAEFNLMMRELAETTQISLNQFLFDLSKITTINKIKDAEIEKDREKFEKDTDLSEKNLETKKQFYNKYDRIKKFLLNFAKKYGLEYNFSIVETSVYASSVIKLKKFGIYINFKNGYVKNFQQVSATYNEAKNTSNENVEKVYYVFYKPSNSENRITFTEFMDYFVAEYLKSQNS